MLYASEIRWGSSILVPFSQKVTPDILAHAICYSRYCYFLAESSIFGDKSVSCIEVQRPSNMTTICNCYSK